MQFSVPPKFVAKPLFRGGHLQTTIPYFLPSRRVTYRATQHSVQVGEGDEIILHDDCPIAWKAGQRVVVLVHGLGGCHGSSYMVRLASRFFDRGCRVFRMDMRGCGAGLLRAAGVFHADRNEDLRLALQHVGALCPGSGITVCGFSLGANLTLKMLAVSADLLPIGLDSAFAVAPPIDLALCCRMLSRGLGRLYDSHFARMLWRDFAARRHSLVRADQVHFDRSPKSLFEFDTHVTVPLGGYESVEHYYESASSGPDLEKIQVPTVILAAEDDPIVPLCVVEDVALSSSTSLVVAEGGGHLGFVAAKRHSSDPDGRWMDWRLLTWTTEAERYRAKGEAFESRWEYCPSA